MSQTSPFSEEIQEAWKDFKGSPSEWPMPKRTTYNDDVIETARSTQPRGEDGEVYHEGIDVYLRDGHTEVPELVTEIAEKHNLEQVKIRYRFDTGEIDYISFAPAQAEPTHQAV